MVSAWIIAVMQLCGVLCIANEAHKNYCDADCAENSDLLKGSDSAEVVDVSSNGQESDHTSHMQLRLMSRLAIATQAGEAEHSMPSSVLVKGVSPGRTTDVAKSLRTPPHHVFAPAQDPCKGKHPCRGFAGCVGKGNEWGQAVATIMSIRATGNMDPVQLFHVDDEIPSEGIRFLENLPHVQVHDMKQILRDPPDVRKYRSYACLSMAIVLSSFDHVMMISGDGIVFSNPSVMWESEVMRKTGAVFVRDRLLPNTGGQKQCQWLRHVALPWFKKMAPALVSNVTLDDFEKRHGDTCQKGNYHEQCSNQVFFDKTRADIRRVLQVLYQLQEAFFDFAPEFVTHRETQAAPVWGEKEFFWMACELAGASCVDSFNEAGASVLWSSSKSYVLGRTTTTYCGHTAHSTTVTGPLLSANLANGYLEDIKGITLPSKTRPVCGTPELSCCTAPAGSRPLNTAEQASIAAWISSCKATASGHHCLSRRVDSAKSAAFLLLLETAPPVTLARPWESARRNAPLNNLPTMVRHHHVKWYWDAGSNGLKLSIACLALGVAIVVPFARWRGASNFAIWAVALYFVVNPLMLLCNKVAITIFPLPSTLLFMQFAFAAIGLRALGACNIMGIEVEPLTMDGVKQFALVAFLLMLQFQSNIHSLLAVPLEIMTCARSTLPLLLLVADIFLFGADLPSRKSIAVLCAITASVAWIARSELLHMDGTTMIWLLLWLILLLLDNVVTKLAINKYPMSNWTRAYYTNVLPLGPLVILIMATEWRTAAETMAQLFVWEWIVVLMSCILGLIMSYSAYLVRDVFLTSTGALVTTACKWIAIIVNNLMWDQHTAPLTTALVLAILAIGMLYEQPSKGKS